MKVAVPAQGKSRNAPVDPHFARARYFLVVDTQNDATTACRNTDSQHTLHLAGTQAAGTLISMGVQAVVVGHIGPKALATFQAAGVQVLQAQLGTVAEALDLFTADRLTELSAANSVEHWPQPT